MCVLVLVDAHSTIIIMQQQQLLEMMAVSSDEDQMEMMVESAGMHLHISLCPHQ